MTTPGATVEIKRWWGARTLITPDAIEVKRGGAMQRYERIFIKGYRTARSRYVTIFTLELTTEPKPLKISVDHGRVGQVRAALAGIRDLDAEDLRGAEDAIRSDEAFGASPEERWKALQSEKWLAGAVNLVCCALGAWAIIYPHPYEWALGACAAVVPLAVIISFLKRRRWYFIPRRNDPHPSVSIGMAVAAVLFGLRTMIDFDVLDWQQLWLIAGVGGLTLAACVLALFAALELKHWPAAFVGVAYAFGIASEANAEFDLTPPQVFQTEVVDMHVSHGRSTSYNITLSPWGPVTNVESHGISQDLYNRLSPGARVCVSLYPGVLHMRWYTFSPCGGGGGEVVQDVLGKPDGDAGGDKK